MFVATGGPCEIDAVVAVESKVLRLGPGMEPMIEAEMAYLNSKSKINYGKCPFKVTNPRTLEAARHLLELIEEDFGKIVFEGGAPLLFGPVAVKAESNVGLPKKLGG